MSSICQIWTSLWLRKHLLESMSMFGKFKIKYLWARNMLSRGVVECRQRKTD